MRANARQYAESLNFAQTAGERSAKELASGLMGILRKKRAPKLAKKILAHLIEAEAEKKGTAEVIIETAHPIESAVKKQLTAEAEKIFPDKKVHADFQVQSSLGAGFRIRSKDKELDQSFATHLKKLRNQLTSL